MKNLMQCVWMMTVAVFALPAAANDIDDNANAILTAVSAQSVGVVPGMPVDPRFAVRVSDNAGHPKAGVLVSFAVDVPRGLPGQPIPPLQPLYGSFEGPSPATVDIRTDANGLATAPPFTAGSAEDRYYDVSAAVDPAADAQTRALIGDGEMTRFFHLHQFAASTEPDYVIVAPSAEGSDVSILPGDSADVTVTIRNTTSTTSPALTFQLYGSYHYALLTPDGCGPLTPVFSDQTTTTLSPIAAGADRSCTFRVSRDADDSASIGAWWSLLRWTPDSPLQSIPMRFGTFADITLQTALVSRTVDGNGVRSIVHLTARNDGASAVTMDTALSVCPRDAIQSVVAGTCTLIPPSCAIGIGISTPVLAWPSIAPGETAACDVSSTIALDHSFVPIGMNVYRVADASTGIDLFAAHGTPPDVTLPLNTHVDVNQYGLSGSWLNPAAPAQGLVINMVSDFYGSGNALLFGGWFTYDTTPNGGQRWYTVQGNVSGTQADVGIYRTEGGALDALQATTTVQVGSARISFSDCLYGQLLYFFDDGTAGTIPLMRLLPNVSCTNNGASLPPAGPDYALTGTWADASASGQGFVLDVDPVHHVLFGGWFAFAGSGIVTPSGAQRWYTVQGDLDAALAQGSGIPIYDSNGGVFNAAGPTSTVAVGSVDIALQTCATATLTYRFTSGENAGRTGTMNLSRLGDPPPGCIR